MKQPLDLTKENLREIFRKFYTNGRREDMYDVIYDLDRVEPELFTGVQGHGADARQVLDYLIKEKDRMSDDEINRELFLIFRFLRIRRFELFPDLWDGYPDWWDQPQPRPPALAPGWDGGRRRRTRRGRKSRRKSLRQRK